MAIDKQSESSISPLDLAVKVVQAVLATLAVYRGARAAINQWQGIIAMFRGAAETEDDEA